MPNCLGFFYRHLYRAAGALLGSIIVAIAGIRLFYVSGETTGVRRIRAKQVQLLSTAVISGAAILMVVLVG
jgi:hypothetical protein